MQVTAHKIKALQEAEREVFNLSFESSYGAMVLASIGVLCEADAPFAVAITPDPIVGNRATELGLKQALVRMELDDYFFIFRRKNVFFFARLRDFVSESSRGTNATNNS